MRKIIALLSCALLAACNGDIRVDNGTLVCKDGSTYSGRIYTDGYVYVVYNNAKGMPESMTSVRVRRTDCYLKGNS